MNLYQKNDPSKNKDFGTNRASDVPADISLLVVVTIILALGVAMMNLAAFVFGGWVGFLFLPLTIIIDLLAYWLIKEVFDYYGY